MEAGQPYELFWRLTLREIGVILDAESNRLKREHNERAWLAWHIEALARQKKLPKLDTLMLVDKKPPRRQTPQELEAVTRSWLASRHRKR